MHGFGYFSRIDELKDASKELVKADIISTEEEYTDEEQAELDNVIVVNIGDEDYKTVGSAGNTSTECDDEIKPQLDSMGLGTSCGIKKEMARTEAFQGSEVIDDESCNMAQEIADSNKIEKIRPTSKINDMFGEMFGKNFGDEKHIHDVSKPSAYVEIDVDGFKVKKGW